MKNMRVIESERKDKRGNSRSRRILSSAKSQFENLKVSATGAVQDPEQGANPEEMLEMKIDPTMYMKTL
jgi:hypothetical protein